MNTPITRNDACILFHNRDEMTKVKLDRVAYFEADGNYTNVVFLNGFKVNILISLSAIEPIIDETLRGKVQPFVRIGKRYIVNTTTICHINTLRQHLVLTDYISDKIFTLSISKEALKNLKELFKNESSSWK
jgi:DNA-binding LytR/AlgR family response regulator